MYQPESLPMNDELKKIVEACHDSPHRVLGPHHVRDDSGKIVIKTFIPHAAKVNVCINKPMKQIVGMNKTHPAGLFEAQVSVQADGGILDYLFQVTDDNNLCFKIHDTYSFQPDSRDSNEETRFPGGKHSRLFSRLGAHTESRNSIVGVHFGVWAPNAQRVSVVGNFNRWDGRCHPMSRVSQDGIWELFIPGIKNGDFYKFEIRSKGGAVFLKTDPYAFRIEDSSEAAAIVQDLERSHHWQDSEWEQRQTIVRSFSARRVCATAAHGVPWPCGRRSSRVEATGLYPS